MKKNEAKEWLDRVYELEKGLLEYRNNAVFEVRGLFNLPTFIDGNIYKIGIHIFSGISNLARELGVEIKKTSGINAELHYMYFEYKDAVVFQILKEYEED